MVLKTVGTCIYVALRTKIHSHMSKEYHMMKPALEAVTYKKKSFSVVAPGYSNLQ